ncbi:MAG: leucine-rich repeat domain-containing protein [bacterium]|nr:leucine-rich repeat domain-containing protein [bacterium]
MKKVTLILVIMVSFAMQALAYDFQAGNLLYTIISTDPPLVRVDGHVDGQAAQGELVIPGAITHEGTTYSVSEIKEGAFYYYTGLDHLTIEEGIEIIGTSAFERCSGLTGDLVIPSSVNEIRFKAFYLCSGLESLTFEEGVEFIGRSAFNECSGLTGDLVIPNTVYEIGIDAFYNCHGFDGDFVLPDNLAIISTHAFYNCHGFTGNLIIPESVVMINWGAFEGCSGFTGDLVIPDSVEDIGPLAFSGCIGFDGTLTIGNSVRVIEGSAFQVCSGFHGDLVIPNSVEEIQMAAFENCTGFDGYLKLSSNLATIGRFAFSGCSGLTGDLFIPNSVTAMGWSAFMDCSGFTGNLEISDNIEEIEEATFRGCNFTSLVMGSSVSKIHSSVFKDNPLQSMTIKAETPPVFINADLFPAFENVPKDIPVIVPCGTLEAYRNAEGWNEFTDITEDCDGIDETAETISVFPNPAQSFVHIEGITASEIQCYNEIGQVVKRLQNSNRISVADLAEGVYFLRITDVNGTMKTKRIMVTK